MMRDPDKKRAKDARYRERNREKLAAAAREYYAKNRERVKARCRITSSVWERRNPEKRKTITACRRARLAGAEGTHTVRERVEKFNALGNRCVYCGSGGKMTIDHATPISRGGTNWIENIVPACGSCNYSKRAKTAEEFMEAHR